MTATASQDHGLRRSRQLGSAGWVIVAVGFVLVAGAAGLALDRAFSGGEARDPATGASRVLDLKSLAAAAAASGHSVFWLGPRSEDRFGYEEDSNGNVRVRYLDGVGSESVVGPARSGLEVGTYPFYGALAATRQIARAASHRLVRIPGGVGFFDRRNPYSVIVSLASQPDFQIEVYHPRKYQALKALRQTPVSIVP